MVILNPASKGGMGARIFGKREDDLRSSLGDFEIYSTLARADATRFVREVLKKGRVDQILVAGGDGTINEVVNGYFDGDALISKTVGLGIINLGSGGDFFRALKQVSPDYATALRDNRTHKVDCGKLTLFDHSVHFMNIASAGVAGKIMYSRENSSFQAGTIAYFYHTIKSLIAYKPGPMVIKYSDEKGANQTLNVSPLNFFACNGKFNGAGMNWAPDSKLDDGLLDVVIIAGVSKMKLVLNSKLVYAGRVGEFPGIIQFRAREITIESRDRVQGEADGEVYESPPGKLHYQIIPGAIPLVM